MPDTSVESRPSTVRPSAIRRAGRILLDILLIIAGAGLNALAINALLIPNEIVAGGVTGLAVIADLRLGLPIGWALVIMNVPLIFLQWRFLGGLGSVLRTALGVASLAAITSWSGGWVGPLTEDRLLVVVYGGVLSGVGLALVFLGRGTTGGGDILGRLCFQFFGWGIGRTMLAVNVVVYGLAGVLFGLEPAMLALLLSYVMSHTLDAVLHGMSSNRVVWIVSRRPDRVTESIARNLGRGVTAISGRGGHSGREVGLLYIVVPRSGIQRLKREILLTDPEAFVTIMSPRESIGGYQSTVPLG